MGFEEILRMPVKTFWRMFWNVTRVRSQFDLRDIKVGQVCFGGNPDQAEQVRRGIAEEMGSPIKLNPLYAERDEKGIEFLKRLGGSKK